MFFKVAFSESGFTKLSKKKHINISLGAISGKLVVRLKQNLDERA